MSNIWLSIGIGSALGAFSKDVGEQPVVFSIERSAIIGCDLASKRLIWRRDGVEFFPGSGKTDFDPLTLHIEGSRVDFDRDLDFLAVTNLVNLKDADCDGWDDHAIGLFVLPVNGRTHCLSRLVVLSGRTGETLRLVSLADQDVHNDQIGQLEVGMDPEGSSGEGLYVTLPYVRSDEGEARGMRWFVPRNPGVRAQIVDMPQAPSETRNDSKRSVDERVCTLRSPTWGVPRVIVECFRGRRNPIEVLSERTNGNRRFEWSPPEADAISRVDSLFEIGKSVSRLVVATRPVRSSEVPMVYALAPGEDEWATAWSQRDASISRVEMDRDGDGTEDLVVGVWEPGSSMWVYALISGATGARIATFTVD